MIFKTNTLQGIVHILCSVVLLQPYPCSSPSSISSRAPQCVWQGSNSHNHDQCGWQCPRRWWHWDAETPERVPQLCCIRTWYTSTGNKSHVSYLIGIGKISWQDWSLWARDSTQTTANVTHTHTLKYVYIYIYRTSFSMLHRLLPASGLQKFVSTILKPYPRL